VKSLEYRLWLFDQATLRQERRSEDQIKRIGKDRSDSPKRETLYTRGALSRQREG